MKIIFSIIFFSSLTVSSLLCQIDTAEYDAYIKQYSKFIKLDFDSAFFYVQKAKDFAVKNNYQEGILRTLYYEALVAHRKGNTQESLEITKEGLRKSKEFNNGKLEIIFLRSIGVKHKNKLEYNLAEEYFTLALSKATNIQDTAQISNVYFSLATLYETIDENEKAIGYYLKTLELDMLQGNRKAMASTYNNLAILLNKMGNWKQALEYINKAIEIHLEISDNYNLVNNYNTKASTFLEAGLIDSSFHYYEKGLSIAKQIDSRSYIISSYYNLGVAYMKDKKYEEALNNFLEAELLADNHVKLPKILMAKGSVLFELNRNQEAIVSLKKAKSIISEDEEKGVFEDLYLALSNVYQAKGDYTNSHYYLEKAYLLSDTIAKSKQSEIVLENEAKFQNRLKEKENQILAQDLSISEAKRESEEAKNSKTTAYLFAAIMALFVAVLIAILLIRKNKQKTELNNSLERRINQLQIVSRDMIHRTNGQFNLATYFIQKKKMQAKKGNISDALEETENWVSSLSTINRHLVINDNNKFQSSLTEIVENLQLGADTLIGKTINTNLSIPSLVTTPHNIIYIGMILNELVTNSIKYAFDKQNDPIIDLKIVPIDNQSLSLVYQDNGIGHKNHITQGGQGMGIINDLVEQLNGTFENSSQNGFCFKAIFPTFLEVSK